MNQLSYQTKNQVDSKLGKMSQKIAMFWNEYPLVALILMAFAVDVFTPYLIWKRYLPGGIRWASDALIAAVLIIVVVRMLVFDRIPGGILLILGISLIWCTVAYFEGQQGLATAWGWWRFFRYPMVAVFAYLQPAWPKGFSQGISKACLFILQINTALQGYQFLGGQQAGDSLAGFFGHQGVIPLLMFIMFTLCLAIGDWLYYGRWRMLMWTIVLGAIASGLGEMKFFPIALILIGLIAIVMQMIEGGQIQRLIIFVAMFSLLTPAFASFYNIVVAEARGTKRIEEYLDPDTLDEYLNRSYSRGGGTFYMGRGFALQYGWQSIQRDQTSFLFGLGIGARGESASLGIVGTGLLNSYYGLTSGTSLLVVIQEFGFVGLVVFAIVNLWIVFVMWRGVRKFPDSESNALRYALILFSIVWPFWLWYGQIWIFPVVMVLYWFSLGHIMSVTQIEHAASKQSGNVLEISK